MSNKINKTYAMFRSLTTYLNYIALKPAAVLEVLRGRLTTYLNYIALKRYRGQPLQRNRLTTYLNYIALKLLRHP